MNIQPNWLDNLFFLGKAHLAIGDKENAAKYLRRAVDCHQPDENEQQVPDMLKEAKVLLKKYNGK